MIALTLAAMLFAAPAPTAAPAAAPVFDRACMDDYGRNLCQAEMRATIRAKLGAEPAEALAARGVEGVRVFMVNGYSRDMPMVSILWPKDGAAVLETRLSREAGAPELLTAPASSWDQSVGRTLMEEVRRSPEKIGEAKKASGQKPDELAICLHAWVSITEVIAQGRVETRVRNACGGDPVFDGGYMLSTLALRTYDRCEALDARQYRNDSERLLGCAALAGKDRYQAAGLLNRLKALEWPDPAEPDGLPPLLSGEATLTLPGRQPVSGAAAVAAEWRSVAPLGKRDGYRIWVRRVDAAEKRATVTGLISREIDDKVETAEFRQEWRTDKAFALRLVAWTVEPFKPAPRP